MATSSAINNELVSGTSAVKVDMKFEVVVIPVADVDRSKAFYTKLGWRLDADFPFDNGFRVVQFTPPGSGCSVQFGTKITTATPGSAQGLYLIVSHVEAAREELVARGIEVSEVFHTLKPGAQFRPESDGRVSGLDPDHRSRCQPCIESRERARRMGAFRTYAKNCESDPKYASELSDGIVHTRTDRVTGRRLRLIRS